MAVEIVVIAFGVAPTNFPEESSGSPALHLNSPALRGRSKQAHVFCANAPRSLFFNFGENRECGYEANQSDVLCLP